MRMPLFLAAVVATSLLGGAALAEKPTEKLRIHGDVIDKTYKTHVVVRENLQRTTRVERTAKAPRELPSRAGAERRNCSADGDECRSTKAEKTQRTRESKSGAKGAAREPKANEKATNAWNCAADVDNCQVSRAAKAEKAGDQKAASPATRQAKQVPASEKAKAEKLIAYLKTQICKRAGADCGER